jgi:hypothetical protein
MMNPVVFIQPANQYALSNGTATFSVEGEGVAGVQYQWQSNGVNVAGATNATLTLSNAQLSYDASYQAVISADFGSITSSAASFTLVGPPQIIATIPSTAPTWINYSPTLTVAATGADPSVYPLSYGWQFNGTNIAGAISSAYILNGSVLDSLSPANEGRYTVIVSNAAGTNTSTWTNLAALPGMVEAWGSDTNGECDRPVTLTNAAGIAAGEYQSVAVTDSGTVAQWGKYSDGTNFFAVTDTTHATLPPASGVVAVAAGLGQALALMANGTVTAWGLTNAYDAVYPTNLTNVKAIACGLQFDVALLNNGTVTAWSSNNPALNTSITNVPSMLTNVTAIAAGGTHTLALQANGTVAAWGYATNGETTVPSGLTNIVTIAAGRYHSLALSNNGTVAAWGAGTSNNPADGVDFGQSMVPAGLSNVMAIAAGDFHSVALKNDGTLVEWGDNSSGQTNVPAEITNTVTTSSGSPPVPETIVYPSIVVKLIAAGGNHTMAAICSSWVQYPIDVSKDLLLIYNSNSLDSSNVCQYYITHRPMVADCTNVLGIGCTTNETTYPTDFTNYVEVPIRQWLSSNPTKRPAYVILFQDIPSRANDDVGLTNSDGTVGYDEAAGEGTPSVQYQLNQWCATNWHPFVTSINMSGMGGTNDCIAYINKLAFIGSNCSSGRLILSTSAACYGNTNWYFDDTDIGYDGYAIGMAAEQALIQDGVSSNSIVYTNANPDCGLPCHITIATNVAGYLCWGWHSSLGSSYATNGSIQFFGQSTWYIMETIESFNGIRIANSA